VELFIAPHEKGWKNAKHHQQWRNTLKTYASPAFGHVPVGAINTAHVLKAIEPIWLSKPETASRLRGRIERILAWAKVRGYRTGENPALWRGHLDQTLPPPNKGKRHHNALPYTQLPSFLLELRSRPATAARALEFVILTAARTGEVIGATWEEIDLQAKTWVVPASRMKAEREHIVPLSDAATAVLECIDGPRRGPIFRDELSGQPLSNMSMLMLLRRMRRDDITTHGFRSTFRDWVAEQTDFADPIAEAALAHDSGDATERAYRRSTFLGKRRRLMDAWGAFCASVDAHVLPLERR
jgi:integrase